MREYVISESEAGLSLLKYASKMLQNAPKGLIHKFLRNKNIELNGGRADAHRVLSPGDRVAFFLSDETFDRFHDAGEESISYELTLEPERVLYEDDDYLFYDKPWGLLTQRDASGRISLNDMLIAYTGKTGVFRPSVCNRLDTNTSGIVLCGKSVTGLKKLTEAVRERRVRKYYRAVLDGCIDEDMHLVAFISASDGEGRVSVSDRPMSGYKEIITDLSVIRANEEATYAELALITGRKHQIRAQAAHIGHPVLGDRKYGASQEKKGPKRQMLHAYRVELPEDILDGMTVFAPVPADMERCLASSGLSDQGRSHK